MASLVFLHRHCLFTRPKWVHLTFMWLDIYIVYVLSIIATGSIKYRRDLIRPVYLIHHIHQSTQLSVAKTAWGQLSVEDSCKDKGKTGAGVNRYQKVWFHDSPPRKWWTVQSNQHGIQVYPWPDGGCRRQYCAIYLSFGHSFIHFLYSRDFLPCPLGQPFRVRNANFPLGHLLILMTTGTRISGRYFPQVIHSGHSSLCSTIPSFHLTNVHWLGVWQGWPGVCIWTWLHYDILWSIDLMPNPPH